jgi:DNA polymerase-3 subunit alpha
MTSIEQAQGIKVDEASGRVLADRYDKSSPEAIALIREWLNFGWTFRLQRTGNTFLHTRRGDYIARVEHELNLIISKGFVDYFLVTSDIVRWAKDHKIPVGPARGSAAASLVCYLLRITEVDPLQHEHMLFERFIDPTRDELPDIDLDFSDDRRHEVFAYAGSRYGVANVGHIGNFTKYKGKNSIDDVARVYHIPKWDCEVVKNLIIERSGGDSRADDSLEDTFAMFPKAMAVLDKHPQLTNAVRLEGNYRGMGVHAAGLVISNRPITDFCAVYTREVAGRQAEVIAYDKKDSASLGFLKQDILGLSTMGMIGQALDIIGMDLEDLYRVPLDDKRTLAAFRKNDVVGIFQFEGRATRLVCRDVVPDHFQHLADINALSRPGPLFSGMAAQYVDIKHGRKTIENYHPIVDKHTEFTYGQIIYQEQVLSIIRELGGFPMTKVHAIRQIISQKLGEAQFESMYQQFEDNAIKEHGCTKEQARRIWRFMATSATYSFNIAHCISYSMLAFWQMWIKQHHQTAFYAAALRKTGNGNDDKTVYKRTRSLKDAMRHGLKIAPPSITLSGKNWEAADNGIIAGFLQVPGIGDKTADNILDYLDNSYWDREPDWDDLINVSRIGPKTMEKIRDFAEGSDPFGLNIMSAKMKELRKACKKDNPDYLPTPTHRSDTLPREGEHAVVWAGIPYTVEYKDYVEDERARSGKSVEEILSEMKDPHLLKSATIKCRDEFDEEVYLRFNRWSFPKFQQAIEDLEIGKDAIVAAGKKREGFGTSIQVKSMHVVVID